MRVKCSLFNLALSAGMLGLLSLPVPGEEIATGKVSENLYEISKPHMKNPLLWPSIWRESPPAKDRSNEFSLQASQNNSSEVAPTNAPTAPAQNDWRTKEERRTRNYLKKMGPLLPQTIQALPPQETVVKNTGSEGPTRHYMSQAITQAAPFLAEASSDSYFPGECKLRYDASNSSEILQMFDEVILSVGQESNIKPGDLYRTYHVGESYKSYASGRNLGRLVETSGIVEVIRVSQKSSVARLVKCFGTIARDSRASPLTAPVEVTATSYNPSTDNKLAAQIVWVADQQQFPQPYSYAIVDRGTTKGYRLGDMVLFFNRTKGKMTDKVLGNGIVVSVGEKSASILIRDLFPGIINRGDYTVVIQSAI